MLNRLIDGAMLFVLLVEMVAGLLLMAAIVALLFVPIVLVAAPLVVVCIAWDAAKAAFRGVAAAVRKGGRGE